MQLDFYNIFFIRIYIFNIHVTVLCIIILNLIGIFSLINNKQYEQQQQQYIIIWYWRTIVGSQLPNRRTCSTNSERQGLADMNYFIE